MRLLIVDDNADFVDAARDLLTSQGITVVGSASNSADAIRRFEELRPDVTLIDVMLGDESGFGLVEQLHRAASPAPSPQILISTHSAHDFGEMIAQSRAIGFLSKATLTAHAICELVEASTRLSADDHLR